jgi:phosphoserine phosphatase
MNKEARVEQMTTVFVSALKGLEQGVVDDIVLIPFHSSERVEVVRTMSDGNKTITIVNAPQ